MRIATWNLERLSGGRLVRARALGGAWAGRVRRAVLRARGEHESTEDEGRDASEDSRGQAHRGTISGHDVRQRPWIAIASLLGNQARRARGQSVTCRASRS